MNKIIMFFFLAFFSVQIMAQENGVMVSVTGINKVQGNLLIAFYNSDAGFLKQDKAVYSKIIAVKENKADVFFKDILKGAYAIAVIHDANSNKELDTNFLGIPTEYIGTSNNIRNMFGPPSFADSKIDFNGKYLKVTISLY